MKKFIFNALCVVIVIFCIAHQCDKSIQKEYKEEANKPKEEIHCIVCNKDLTNDYNRIRPNGDKYFCTPCYKATMRDVHERMQAEGYD